MALWLILRACSLIGLLLPSIVSLYPEEALCIPQRGFLRLYSPECLEGKFSEVLYALLDILERSERGLEAAAQAGVLGARLRPPTERPLLEVRPLLEK